MEFETVILRFRDLVTENNVTIARHKDMIDKKGYVWWGGGIRGMRSSHLKNSVC